MKAPNFTTTILVDAAPTAVFNAINQPQNWWTGEFTGSAEKLNDVFTYRYKDMHYSKQRMAEIIPGKKIVWLVTESELNFIEDKTEWNGTKIIFEIDEKDGKTRLRFTHEGITPEVECFSACSPAWTNLIQQSLFNYISTGEKQSITLD